MKVELANIAAKLEMSADPMVLAAGEVEKVWEGLN
jgi:hypothetical protein